MNKFFIKVMCAMSFVCATNVYAMDSDFSKLELRNASKFPAKVTIYYDMQGVNEGCGPFHQYKSVDLKPISTDGPDNQLIPNPKRYGLVSVDVAGGIKFHKVVDLISVITVGSNGTIFHDFSHSRTEDVAPNWLYNSVTFKKFDTKGYGSKLLSKWENLTAEQKLTPLEYDIPSCIHVVDKAPEMVTSFPLCFNSKMKNSVLAKYSSEHPEIIVSEEEIQALEAELISKGLPLVKH